MRSPAKRLLALLTVLAMALSLLPGFVLAANEEVLVAEGSATFATDMDAFIGTSEFFTPDTNGNVTVQILSCNPGYYVDLYKDGDWLEEYVGTDAESVTFPVTAGFEYEILLCSYNATNPTMGYAQAGSISYKITFLSNGEIPGGDEEPEDPGLTPGATEGNPLVITGSHWNYIGAGKTVWYLYDNTQNMEENSVYSMLLHITSSADYTAVYAGQVLSVDENGFVNYEMMDTEKQGIYRFSITNNSAEEKFFSMEIKEKPDYFDTDLSLNTGRNNITLNSDYPYTLYAFSPAQTGIYQIRVAQGQVGNWGTPYNPVDNTPNKTNTLIWTCTAVGQSVMVGFKGPKSTTCTIIRTGDYVPPVEIPWTFYENTYDFSYVLDADAQIADIDLTDGGVHTAVLGADGFYHYGGADGPLMVADLSTAEIDLANAYVNGGLRAWLQDADGETISKIDYNEALNAYYKAGLVPVTEELAVMLQELGQAGGWWLSSGLVFAGEAPADVSMAWMQLCSYLVEPEGVTLSGSVTAGIEGDATIELLENGEVITTVTASGTYTIENLQAGTYTLKVSKVNHVTREYTVTVQDEAVTQNVKIHLLGDIDGNGKVNTGDVAKLNAHLKGSNKLTDQYQLLCANVNGGSLNMGDTATLYAHTKGTKVLY